jgi:hypothetical protein
MGCTHRSQVAAPAADGRGVRSGAWRLYAVTMAVAVVAFALCPPTGIVPVVWQVAIGWAGAAAVVVGVRMHRPGTPAAWYLFATGVLLNSTGIAVEAYLTRGGRELGSPSVVDAFYLGLYPSVVAGLVLVLARRSARRDWASLVDALMISTGLGLLLWVTVIRPALGDPAYSPLGQIVVIAYPIGDLVVLALITRLLIGAGGRGFAWRALATTVLLFLAGDLAWAVINQLGADPGPRASALLSTIFLAGFALFGVAALHPSVCEVAVAGTQRRLRAGAGMIAVLTGASLIAPACSWSRPCGTRSTTASRSRSVRWSCSCSRSCGWPSCSVRSTTRPNRCAGSPRSTI